MPDLETAAVTAWVRDRVYPGDDPRRLAPSPIVLPPDADRAVVEMGLLLDRAHAANPERLALMLTADPARADLQDILARLGPTRLMRLCHWMAGEGEARRDLLAALLAPGPRGMGQVLGETITAVHRSDLIARLFHPQRVEALRKACRTLPGKAAS